MAGHRASRPQVLPTSIPLVPHTGNREISFQTSVSMMNQFLGQGNQSSSGVDEQALNLLRSRVIPPSGLIGSVPQGFIADGSQVDTEEEIPGAMNSGTYFTNLISDGITNSTAYAYGQPVVGETQEQEHAQTAPKGHQKRSKNFSIEEDKLLVSAWLNVTLDPIQGVDQSRSSYWKRIHDYFHANKNFNSDRSQSSLMNRWSGIQHDVNVFAGCLSKIEARNHSGWSVDDKLGNACTMFKAEDKFHRNFAYMHCWNILKDKPKWMDRCQQIGNQKSVCKKQKTTADSSPSSGSLNGAVDVNETQLSQGAQERPVGKKKEKQKLEIFVTH